MNRLEFHIKQINKGGKFKYAVRNMADPDYCLAFCSSIVKADNQFKAARRKWLNGATEFKQIAEKEDKE